MPYRGKTDDKESYYLKPCDLLINKAEPSTHSLRLIISALETGGTKLIAVQHCNYIK